MKKGAGAVTRQSGGMRQSFGGMSSFDGERMEQQAIQGATQQKAVQQQSGSTGTSSSDQHNSSQANTHTPPREMGSLTDELVKRPAKDVAQELKGFFDLNSLLEINQEDTPEEQAKKRQLHQRFQQLTQSEQKVAQEKYERELQKKQQEERLKQQEEEEQRQKDATVMPEVGKVSRRGTALMGGSQKKKAAARMAHDRQRIGKVAGAN